MAWVWLLVADPPWSPNVRVDDNPGDTSQNETALSGLRELYAGSWNDARTLSVAYSTSSDGGTSWLPNDFLEPFLYRYTCDPVVHLDSRARLHYVLLDFTYENGDYVGVLWHLLSPDTGQTWGAPVRITPYTDGLPDRPWLVGLGDTLFVSYALLHSTEDGIRLARSTDGGSTWQVERISSSYSVAMPFVCADWGGNLYVSWRDYGKDVYQIRCSQDFGETWGPENVIDTFLYTSDGTRAPAHLFTAGGPPGHVYAVYMSEKYSSSYQWDILFTKSTDYGQNWSTPIAINTLTGRPHKAKLPTITVDPYGNIWVIWAQYNAAGDGKWSVEWAVSLDEGETWTTLGYFGRVSDVSFPDAGGGVGGFMYMGDYMTAISDSDYVAVLWADDRDGDYKVYFSKMGIPPEILEMRGARRAWARWTPRGLLVNLPEASELTVRAYSVDGRLVAQLYRFLSSGRHLLTLSLPKGVYFLRVEAGHRTFHLKALK